MSGWPRVGYLTDLVFDVFFFFQAEDGIRDRDVTGVQTCALPISSSSGYGGVDVPGLDERAARPADDSGVTAAGGRRRGDGQGAVAERRRAARTNESDRKSVV